MNDLKLSSLIILIFTICLIVGWSRLESLEKDYKAKLSDLRHSKAKDSTNQANTNDSLRQVIYEAKNVIK